MPSPATGGPKRKHLTLDIKKEIIDRKEKGEGNSAIGRSMGLNESSVRAVWRKKDDILRAIKAYGSSKIDDRKRAPDEKVVVMERYLNVWINRKEREGVPLDKKQIQEMAMTYYRTICHKQKVQPGSFKASTGWLYRFMGRKSIKHLNLTGESASADQVAADNFPAGLRQGMMEPFSEFVKEEIKEEPADNHVSSSHLTTSLQQPSGVDRVRDADMMMNSSEDPLKIETKEEPLDDHQYISVPVSSSQQASGMSRVRAKRKNADEKREIMKTGEGPPPKPEEDPTLTKVLGLTENELQPNVSVYDCHEEPRTSSNRSMQAIVMNDDDTCTYSLMDIQLCGNGPEPSNRNVNSFESGPETHSTTGQTPITFSASLPPSATSTPIIKRASDTEKTTTKKRIRSQKFSVTDTCMKESMKYKTKRHEIEMDVKGIEKEYRNMKMQWLKGEMDLQKIRKEKEKKKIEAALALITAANAIREHFREPRERKGYLGDAAP